ncbi:MAG TPA: GAP family protein [Solirubrobacteraceae bacterium]
MPPGALSLALAASIYPPAVAVVIALGKGSDVRLRVVLLVSAAIFTVFATGVLILLLFDELGVSGSHHRTPSAGLEIAIGLLLVGLAYRLAHPRAPKAAAEQGGGPSKTERYLESRRLVLVLGVILYALPSPIFLAAVKSIADANVSTSSEIAYLAITVIVMLWMIEVPMLMLLLFPARAAAMLESVNDWFARHGRRLGVAVAAAAGAYLIAAGIVKLLS